MPSDHPVHNDREDSRVYRSLVHIVVDGQWMWTFDVQTWGTLCEDEASHDGNDPGLALRFFHLSAFSELHSIKPSRYDVFRYKAIISYNC